MKYIVHLCLIFICLPFLAQGQNDTRIAKIQSLERADFSHRNLTERNFFQTMENEIGLSHCSFSKGNSPKSKTKYNYSRYQQYYKNIEIVGGVYILHTQNGKVMRGRGKLIPDLDINTSPLVSLNFAQEIAASKLVSNLMNVSPENVGNELPEFALSDHRLVIIGNKFPEASENYTLAYELNLVTEQPRMIDETLYIDAHSGRYINHFTNVHSAPIETDIQTFQYGKQTVTVEEESSSLYLLEDNTRNGNRVLDSENGSKPVTNQENNFDTDNSSVPWAAADAHYCTSKYHDFMIDQFEWNGVDGIGGAMLTRVNQGGQYWVNATWNGTFASFGNGDCDSYFPLTILDVVGHEYAHGFVDFTSDLVYQDQSGALNESTADIFGKSLEYVYDADNFTWSLAKKAARTEDVTGFRSMSDPHLKSDPKAFGGEFWFTGTADRGGVHTNSGVMNYWYYLLVEGESGTNEFGYDYNVEAIGLEDALQIVYHAHLGGLTLDSDYFDAMYSTIEAAGDLYGTGSVQQENVIEAWMTANLFPGMDDIDLSIEAVTENVSICPGEVKPGELKIRNVGNLGLPAGQTLSLNYTLNGTDHVDQIILATDFNLGDSISHVLTQEISGIFTGTTFLEITLEVEGDLNAINNLGVMTISGSLNAGMDTNLLSFSFTQDEECGIPTLTRYSYTIQNVGCESLSVGDSIIISVDVGDDILEFRRALFFDFTPGSFQGASLTLTEPLLGDFQNYTAWVEFKDVTDINTDNNSQSGKISFLDVIDDEYLEDFSPDVDDSVFFISSSTFRGVDTIIDYNGNHMLAFTGQRRAGNYNDCADLDDFYEDYNYHSIIRYCADATSMDRPFFAFDLIQLRNTEFNQAIGNDFYQTIVRVVTDSTSYDYIYGLEDGVSTYFEYELPQNYVGKIEIQAIALTGYEFPFTEEEHFGLTDAALIDNIRFFDKTVDEAKFGENEYIVYPNPTSNILNVQSKDIDTDFDVYLYDQLGREILRVTEQNRISLLDLSHLSGAVYFLTVVQNQENVYQQKIVVTP